MAIHQVRNERLFHYGLLTLACFLIYADVFSLGFFSDDYTGIQRYREMGYNGISDNYKNPFFMPINFWVQLTELRLFGENYLAIKIFNMILFSMTSIGLYHLSLKIGSLLKLESTFNTLAALGASLLFICSPYQTETVNWFASQAYLLSTLGVVVALNFYITYRTTKKRAYFFWYLIFFVLAILNKEIALITPLIAFGFGLLLFDEQKGFARRFIWTAVIYGIYLSFRSMYLGEYIGGYGIDTHLNFDIKLLTTSVLAYTAKFFLFYRYIPQDLKSTIILIFGSLIVGMVTYIYFGKSQKKLLFKTALGLFILFLISLIPVLNLETSFLGEIQSDRYGYLPSLFFTLFLVFPTVIVFKRYAGLIFIPLIIISTHLTTTTNQSWKKAAIIRDNFISAVKDLGDEQDLVILNLPDSYEGVYLFRHGFVECLGLKKTKGIRTLFSHALSTKNLIIHEKLEDGTLQIQIYNGSLKSLDKEFSASNKTTKGYIIQIDKHFTSTNSIYYFNNEHLVRAN